MCGAEWIRARFIQYTRESVARTAIDFKLYISFVLLLVLLLHTGIVLVSSTKWHSLSFPEKEKRLYLLIADIIDFFHRNNPVGYRLGAVVFLE